MTTVTQSANVASENAKYQRFQVYNGYTGETVGLIEIEVEKVNDKDFMSTILDFNTGTCRPLKHGGNYTLIPLESHLEGHLRHLRNAYVSATAPLDTFYGVNHRADTLLESVKMLFKKKVKYTLVEKAEDLQAVLDASNVGSTKTATIVNEYSIFEEIMRAIGTKEETIKELRVGQWEYTDPSETTGELRDKVRALNERIDAMEAAEDHASGLDGENEDDEEE